MIFVQLLFSLFWLEDFYATQATKLQQQQENKKANYQDCVHEKCTFH